VSFRLRGQSAATARRARGEINIGFFPAGSNLQFEPHRFEGGQTG